MNTTDAATTTIKPGDMVELKAGGPTMTVERTSAAVVRTAWFEGSTLKQGEFEASALKIVTTSNYVG